MKSGRVEIPCGELRLEGELGLPDGSGPFPVVVLCHPHPLYGGDMDNNVVVAVYQALMTRQVAALRFNFRGVGKSTGSFGGGVGENDDIKAALDFLGKQATIDTGRIGLAGYSFGGAVALSVALVDGRIKRLMLISPALGETAWSQLKGYPYPALVVVGDNDTVVPFRGFQRLFGDAQQYQIITGADHSWWAFEEEMGKRAGGFFIRLKD